VVNDLELIKVRGGWPLKAIPQGSAEIVGRFEGILSCIDRLPSNIAFRTMKGCCYGMLALGMN
jgi:hypothetical protein